MSDRNQVRDRTLVLRVLVPSLEARLRDKMKEAEDLAAARATQHTPSNSMVTSTGTDASPKEVLMDLEGVTCEPTDDGSTLWNFHCDGAIYPARLVNLPCPVELHKTHDHAMYYKCTDIAQLLIVYEDQMALEEAEATPGYKTDTFPSYYHSGLTPPMKRVVERRFAAKEHEAIPPPRMEVADVEFELQDLMEAISKDSTRKAKNKAPTLTTTGTKVIEEIVEEIVDYEPWMDDHGRQPYGIEFDEKDNLCTKHPELWLDPEEVAAITKVEAEKEKEDAAAAKKKKSLSKKDGTKKKMKKKVNTEQEAPESKGPSTKKGIPAKKTMEEVDEITQVAAQMSQNLNEDDIMGDVLDDFFDFGDDDPVAEFQLE